MNVSCPDCRSIFRVDPAKVPPSGVRARCSVCSGVITIPAPTGQTFPSGGTAHTATPSSASLEQSRTTPAVQGGWDSPPYGSARQTPAAAPTQRPAAAQPPRASEVPPAPRIGREERIERGPVTATATPPSPAGSLPEFTPPPPVPPFTPSAAAPAPVSPFTPPAPSASVPSAPPFVPSAPASRPPAPRPPA